MHRPTVWLNKHLSNTWEVLALLRQECGADEFRLASTHLRAHYPGRRYSDVFEQEPERVSDEEYVDYCLDFARRHRVGLFLPGRKLLPIVRARDRFAAAGVQVLAAADHAGLALLNDKAQVYAALDDEPAVLPAYKVVHDLAEFDAAWCRLRRRHRLLCYKPAVSLYGLGFHIVSDDAERHSGPAGRRIRISLEEARAALAARTSRRPLLLMQYLPGPERSVDCLAIDGELIRCVIRRKEKDGQVLEENAEVSEMVRRLTARFRLNHLFNVQFRNSGPRSYLLEINTRMSGGLPFACRSGLVLLTWAIRLALGTAAPHDVPRPRTGVWVPQPEPAAVSL